MAGLGTIGANNLLVTPQYGPRVRLRALVLDCPLEPTGPVEFDPCAACGTPCLQACPRGALVASGGGQVHYSRAACSGQMLSDEADAASSQDGVTRYCRRCELVCPVGPAPEATGR